MKKDPLPFLEHILESIQYIRDDVGMKTKNDFFVERPLQDVVIRRIEIIGEAVKHLPWVIRERYPGIPWKTVAGMRDVLIHEYFDVDLEITWDVVQMELPKLKRICEQILREIKNNDGA